MARYRVAYSITMRTCNEGETVVADDYSIGYAGELTFCTVSGDEVWDRDPVKTFGPGTWESVTMLPKGPGECMPG